MMDDAELANLEDEEFDAINDETFGDIAEYKWEESHSNLNPPKEKILDEGRFVNAKKEAWDDDYDAAEEEMEANVSKLLLDDLDDLDTEDVDKYYAAPQSLENFYSGGAAVRWNEGDAESRNSLLGSSVWGIGSTAPGGPVPHGSKTQNDRASDKPKARPMNLHELEEGFFKENEALSRKKPAKAIRAEDLEREMKEQSNVPQKLVQQMPQMVLGHQGQIPHVHVGMLPPYPYNMNAMHLAAANHAQMMHMQQHHRMEANPIEVKHILREHALNARMMGPEGLRHNKPFPHMYPQFMPNIPPPLQHPLLVMQMPMMPPAPPPPFTFDGLMTDRDKQRIKNIQIIQLQNDHPHKNDYYYQMHLIRTNPPNSAVKDRALRKLFPPEAKQPNKFDYKPVQFDKSLGKIQASSAQAPRKIFDIDNSVKSKATVPQQTGYHRTTLAGIEETFKQLLLVEEIVMKMNVHPDREEELRDDLYISRTLLYSSLMKDQLHRVLSYRKGRILVFKALPRLETLKSLQLLATVVGYFSVWSKTVETDMDYSIALKTLLTIILDLDAHNSYLLAAMLDDKEIISLLRSRLGLSIYNIITYVLDRHHKTLQAAKEMLEKYMSFSDKIDSTIIPCVLTPKYIDKMMKMSIDKCKSVQDGRRSFEEWAKMENSVYIRKTEPPLTFGLYGFPQETQKFWQSTNVLWIDE